MDAISFCHTCNDQVLLLFVKSKHQHVDVHSCFGIIYFDAFLSIKLKVQAKSVHAFGNASLGVVRRPVWR
jgi:hypothetical protein